jgi:hypothetical protein
VDNVSNHFQAKRRSRTDNCAMYVYPSRDTRNFSRRRLHSLLSLMLSTCRSNRISPYSSLLQIKHLANKLAYRESSTPNVFWQNHAKTCLVVNGAKLHIQAIRDLSAWEGATGRPFPSTPPACMDPNTLPLQAADGNT